MGKDDLFHKRKAKQANAVQRKTAHRQTNKRVLIVCEGETGRNRSQKHLPNY